MREYLPRTGGGRAVALDPTPRDLLQPKERNVVQVCKRETIIDARKTDWMEWQAGYVCGAFLMPISLLRAAVGAFQQEHEVFVPVAIGTPHASAAIICAPAATTGTPRSPSVEPSPLRRLDGRAHSPRGRFDRPSHRRALRADPCWSPIACWRRTTDGRELLLRRSRAQQRLWLLSAMRPVQREPHLAARVRARSGRESGDCPLHPAVAPFHG
jgi:hypothetical protein